MFARHSGILGNPIPVSAVVLALAAVSFAAVPAHGFGLKHSWEDGVTAATNYLNAPGKEDPGGNGKSPGQKRLHREVDREMDRIEGKAADEIERGMWKAGEKGWKRLEKTKTLDSLAKKLGKRWGPVVAKGVGLSPQVGMALTVWDLTYAVGDKLIAPKVVSAIEQHFENTWKEGEEQRRQDIAHYRGLGEQRRQGKKDVLDMLAVGQALKKLRENKRGPWAATENPWGEDSTGASAAARSVTTPSADQDPWKPDAPDARSARPVAVAEPEEDPWSRSSTGSNTAARDAADPWASETPEVRFLQPVTVQAAPAPVKDVETGPSNYEKALNAIQGGGTRSAGYEKALQNLEADRRAARARTEAEAKAARQRQAARAAEDRRRQARREATSRREAAARERERQQGYERAARERRGYSRRRYNESVRQTNRAMQILQQTRQQQQRAYRQQKTLQLQRQRQQRLEQARRQRIYEQQRERDRQSYEPNSAGSSCPPGYGQTMFGCCKGCVQ